MTNSTDMQALENNLQTDDSFKQKQALLKLLTSEDFAELQAISNNKFNIFQALKLQNNEVKHSNFLGWLLNPFESHYLMDCFFKELLKIALRNDSILVDIILKDLTDAKVTLEKMTNDGRRMDIFIDCPRNKLVCVIENKIWSGEGCNQLEDYRNYILNNDKYKDYKYKIFLFLTPYKYSPCEDYKGYIRINYGDILKAINNLMKQYGCLLEDDVGDLRQYRVDKISELAILDEYFEKDEKFSLSEYSNNSFGVYQEKPIDIVLEFDKSVANDVLNYHFHPTQKIKQLENENVQVEFKSGGTYAICQELFKWGCSVKIQKPVELKNYYKRYLTDVLNNL